MMKTLEKNGGEAQKERFRTKKFKKFKKQIKNLSFLSIFLEGNLDEHRCLSSPREADIDQHRPLPTTGCRHRATIIRRQLERVEPNPGPPMYEDNDAYDYDPDPFRDDRLYDDDDDRMYDDNDQEVTHDSSARTRTDNDEFSSTAFTAHASWDTESDSDEEAAELPWEERPLRDLEDALPRLVDDAAMMWTEVDHSAPLPRAMFLRNAYLRPISAILQEAHRRRDDEDTGKKAKRALQRIQKAGVEAYWAVRIMIVVLGREAQLDETPTGAQYGEGPLGFAGTQPDDWSEIGPIGIARSFELQEWHRDEFQTPAVAVSERTEDGTVCEEMARRRAQLAVAEARTCREKDGDGFFENKTRPPGDTADVSSVASMTRRELHVFANSADPAKVPTQVKHQLGQLPPSRRARRRAERRNATNPPSPGGDSQMEREDTDSTIVGATAVDPPAATHDGRDRHHPGVCPSPGLAPKKTPQKKKDKKKKRQQGEEQDRYSETGSHTVGLGVAPDERDDRTRGGASAGACTSGVVSGST